MLDRRVPVWCPHDPFLHYGLQHLGFRDVHCLLPFVPQQCGGLRLLQTPSLNREVLEFGCMLQDETGTIFNQVDTFLAADTVQRLRHAMDQLDVHLAMYASQNFHLFESKREQTAAMHGINLHTACLLAARCVVPASAGFRFTDDLAWLNQHVFPISAARFVDDLHQLNPTLQTLVLQPGDTLIVAQGDIAVQRQASAVVTMLEDDTQRLAYDAFAPIPPLQDLNPAGYELRGLQEFAQGLLETGLPQYLVQGLATGEPLVTQYMRYGVLYQVDVVFPNGETRCWTYRGDRQQQTVHHHPGASPSVPHMRKSITASALVDFCLGRRSYFAVRTQSRRSSQVFELRRTAQGIVAQDVELHDLLTHSILHAMPGAEHRGADWINFVTKDYVGQHAASAPATVTQPAS